MIGLEHNNFFDNEDSISLYYYLLENGLDTDKVKLKPCIKWKNRINIEIIFNGFKTIICPALTTYHWFSVSRQAITSTKELNNNDILEFSAEKTNFHKLLNLIYSNIDILNVSKTINKIKKDILKISEKIKNERLINYSE